MTDRPRRELVLRALSVLQVVQTGQTPADEDITLVDSLWEPLVDKLAGMEITTITNPEVVPGAQFLDLAVLLADEAKGDFGLAALPDQYDPIMAVANIRAIVMVDADLYDVTVTDPDTGVESTEEHNEPLVTEYF